MKLTAGTWAFLIFLGITIIQLFTDIPILVYFFAFVLISIFGFIILTKFDLVPSFGSRLSKEEANITKLNLKIDDKKWRKFSNEQRQELYHYYHKQENLKSRLAAKILWNKKEKISDLKKLLVFIEDEAQIKRDIRNEIEKDWQDLNMEERIKFIKESERKNEEEYRKNKIHNDKNEI